MKKRRTVMILFLTTIIGISAGIIFLYAFSQNKDKSDGEGDVTRYQWIEMLSEQMGMTEYENGSPYFSDVLKQDFYFSWIQSAVEWGVLEPSSKFEGDDYASGKFIAVTAMKTIGESKLQIYLNAEDAIPDDTYIELAIEHGLIEEEQLIKGLSKEECGQVLELLKNLYFSEFWKDDYSNVIYQNGVLELSPEDVLQSNADGSEIVASDNIVNLLTAGTIIVFEQEYTRLKLAREVTGIDSDGTLSLGPVELDKVVESLTVSDITELTFADIVNYYGLEENADTVNNLKYHTTNVRVINTAVFSADINSKGFKLSLFATGEEKEKHLEVQVTDNATGVSYILPIEEKVEADSEYSAEINIDKISIGGQVSYSVWNGLEYAEAAVDTHATFRGMVKADKEKKILLCKTPVPLGNGLVGADIQIYLVLSMDGSISFEAELPIEACIYYEKDSGFRNFKHDISIAEPMVEADCNAGVMLRLEPTLVILDCVNVMDTEADMGVTANANVITRPNSQICADISVSFPVMMLSVCGDDDADTIIGGLGLSAEWEIILSSEAPFQFGLHYEILSDKTSQFVEKCTYQEDSGKVEGAKADDVKGLNHTYTTRFREIYSITVPAYSFDYSDDWEITKEENDDTNPVYNQWVTLTNSNGTEINYICFKTDTIGGYGRFMYEYEVSKVADSSFVPGYPDGQDEDYSWLGDFMVAEIVETGELYMDTDEDFSPIHGAKTYAVIPEFYLGEHEAIGLSGYYEEFSFEYSGFVLFYAQNLNGGFSAEDEEQVIDILSSFRTADGITRY